MSDDRSRTHNADADQVENPQSEVAKGLDRPDVEHGVVLCPVDVGASSGSRSTAHLTS